MKIWHFQSLKQEELPIIPDGCRDLIFIQNEGDKTFHISELMTRPKLIKTTTHQSFTGIRLAPGTIISNDISKVSSTVEDEQSLLSIAQEFTFCPNGISEALEALSHCPTTKQASKHLGVQERTLQRYLKKNTGKTPNFWRQLARIRKASRLILYGEDIVEASYQASFSDQSHLTREMRKWFATTPQYLKKHKNDHNNWVQQFLEPGYDSFP